jgi:hypothetical protein
MRDVGNLTTLLGEYGGGDGTPVQDPVAYGRVSQALSRAQARALAAAEALAGLPGTKPARKLTLEERRARVAQVFGEGIREGARRGDADSEERAAAYAQGKVPK